MYKHFFTAFLNVLGLSMYVTMSHGRLLKILIPDKLLFGRCSNVP